MTALSADAARQSIPWGDGGSYPVLTGTTIYKDSIVCADANGYAIPATDTAGLYVLGIATEQVVNSGASGAKWIKVHPLGRAFLFAATSITQAMVGEMMYVVDDNTVDETSTNLVPVGILVKFVSVTSGWVLVAPSMGYPLSGLTATAGELNYNDITAAGTAQASKALVADANVQLQGLRRPVVLAQGTDTLTVAESGTLFVCTVDAVLTLPDCTTCEGAWYTIMCGALSVGTGLSVSPAAADNIRYTGLTSVDNKDIINTGASDVVGDFITLVSDGVDGWVVIGMGGIWAKE